MSDKCVPTSAAAELHKIFIKRIEGNVIVLCLFPVLQIIRLDFAIAYCHEITKFSSNTIF